MPTTRSAKARLEESNSTERNAQSAEGHKKVVVDAYAIPPPDGTARFFDLPQTVPMTTGTATLREQINNIAQHTPRYLFRAWSSDSGGNSALNTPDAITPLAFHERRGPDSILDLSRDEIAGLAIGHFRSEHVQTVFSSWSHSLSFVLGYAHRMPRDTAHISIIDTQSLADHNVVLHTPMMAQINLGIPSGAMEFMAFGVISGDSHKAVAVKDINASRFVRLLSETNARPTLQARVLGLTSGLYGLIQAKAKPSVGPLNTDVQQLRSALEAVQSVGTLFGRRFALAVTVHLLSIWTGRSGDAEAIFSALQATVTDEDVSLVAVDHPLRRSAALINAEAARTFTWLDIIANTKHQVETQAAGQERARRNGLGITQPGSTKSKENDGDASAEVVRKSTRSTRRAKNLHIDMIGWDDDDDPNDMDVDS